VRSAPPNAAPAASSVSGAPSASAAPSGTIVVAVGGLEGIDTAAKVTSDTLRARFGGYDVWEDTFTFENAPDHPEKVLCVGRSKRCAVRIFRDAEARIVRLHVLEAEVEGPAGLRVGAAYASAREAVDDCKVSLGDESGLVCTVRGAPHVQAWFLSPALLPESAKNERPTPKQLDGATLHHLDWTPPPSG
jgi:hypothetical protein